MDTIIAGVLDAMIKIHGEWGADPDVAAVCEQIKAALNLKTPL